MYFKINIFRLSDLGCLEDEVRTKPLKERQKISQVMAPLWGHSTIYNESIAFSKSEISLFAPNVMNGLHNPRGDNLSAINPTNPFTLLPRSLSLLVDGK